MVCRAGDHDRAFRGAHERNDSARLRRHVEVFSEAASACPAARSSYWRVFNPWMNPPPVSCCRWRWMDTPIVFLIAAFYFLLWCCGGEPVVLGLRWVWRKCHPVNGYQLTHRRIRDTIQPC